MGRLSDAMHPTAAQKRECESLLDMHQGVMGYVSILSLW